MGYLCHQKCLLDDTKRQVRPHLRLHKSQSCSCSRRPFVLDRAAEPACSHFKTTTFFLKKKVCTYRETYSSPLNTHGGVNAGLPSALALS